MDAVVSPMLIVCSTIGHYVVYMLDCIAAATKQCLQYTLALNSGTNSDSTVYGMQYSDVGCDCILTIVL